MVTRALARMGANSKTARAGLAAAQTAGKEVARSAHVLWLEVAGFFFACFAVIGGGAAWRAYLHHAETSKVAVGAIFAAAFAYFAVTSFIRARRRARRA